MNKQAISPQKICAAAVLSTYFVASLTVPRGYFLTAFGDISQCCLLLCLFVIILRNVLTSEKRTKLFWAFVALGCALWFTAQSLWTWFEVFLRKEVPNPFVGDVILVLHLVPMMGALALQPHFEHDEQTGELGALDFVLLIIWWLYLYIFLVVPWQFVSPDGVRYGSGFDISYFLEHFVFLICAAIVWIRSDHAWRRVYKHLLVASLLYFIASMAASVAIDFGKYYTGSYFDLPLVFSMLWFLEFGLTGRQLALRPSVRNAAHERLTIWVSGVSMATILPLPVLATWALYVSNAPLAVRNFRVLLTLGTMLLMGGFVWVKQHHTDQQLARRNQELREDSLTDPLTKCRNRRFFEKTVEPDVQHAIRSHFRTAGISDKKDRDLVFYLIDCDSFKQINDAHGHQFGDQVLVEMTRRISSAIRHSDVLIRWGGDEFMVVSRYTDRSEAVTLATRVLQNVGSTPFELHAVNTLRLTCSVGWAVFPWFVDNPETVGYENIIRLADSALYQAKKAGRNRAVGMLPTLEKCPETLQWITSVKHEKLLKHLLPYSLLTLGPGSGSIARSAVQKPDAIGYVIGDLI